MRRGMPRGAAARMTSSASRVVRLASSVVSRSTSCRRWASVSVAMALAAIVGTIVSTARNGGDPGGYGVICFVGGVTYAVSLFVLKRKN